MTIALVVVGIASVVAFFAYAPWMPERPVRRPAWHR